LVYIELLKEYDEQIVKFRDSIISDTITEFEVSKVEIKDELFEVIHFIFNAFMYHPKHDEMLEDIRYESMLHKYLKNKKMIKIHDIYSVLSSLRANTQFYLCDDNIPNVEVLAEINSLYDEIMIVILELIEDVRVNHIIEDDTKMLQAQKKLSSEFKELKIIKHKIEEEETELQLEQNKMSQMSEILTLMYDQWKHPISIINTVVGNSKIQLDLDNIDKVDLNQSFVDILTQTSNLSETIATFRTLFEHKKNSTNTNLTQIIDKTIEVIKLSFNDHNIDIVSDFIFTDDIITYEHELMLVLLNILKNAEKALIKNRITMPIVVIVGYQDAEYQYIEIMNNGGIIPQNILDNMFNPNFALDDQSKKGFGLYMSKSVIENQCMGEFVVSNTDEGVKFRIALPLLNKGN